MPSKGPQYTAFETLTIEGTGLGFTAATIAGLSHAVVTVETAPVRFRLDGTAPTASVGHLLNIGDVLEFDSPEQLAGVLFIRTTGTSATLSCSYGNV